jgi:SAM-dependent methyltransferase
MPSPADYHPTERFTGLAQLYSQYRPTYAACALDFAINQCHLGEGSVLVDIGCGTGISTRQFAERGIPVIGIEPNEEMRQQAQNESSPAGAPNPKYLAGRAEATGLPDSCADAVLAAQAFHWFVPEEALREFHRIIKPDAYAVLLWNQRDESDPFTRAYGVNVRNLTDAEVIEPFHGKGQVLLSHPLFQDGIQAFFPHKQVLDETGFLGRAFSASYAPQDGAKAKLYAEEIRTLFRQFQANNQVTIRYETSVFLARRRALVSPGAKR